MTPETRWLLTVTTFLFLLQAAEPRKKNERVGMGSPLNVTAVQGVSIIELKCRVRVRDCGNFHSIKWYKEPIDQEGRGRQVTDDIVDDVEMLMDLRGTEQPMPAERVYVFFQGKGKAEGSWTGKTSMTIYTFTGMSCQKREV